MKENQLEKLHGLLSGFSTVLLVTMGGPHGCHSRPMAVARVDQNTDLWLVTARDSQKVREIDADSRVQVHAQEGWANCVVLTGRASVVDDRALIREIWRTAFTVWFPEGADDPNIVLLHVTGEQAEYWDSTGTNGLRYVYQSLKALVTGATPEITEGKQHGTVTLAKYPPAPTTARVTSGRRANELSHPE